MLFSKASAEPNAQSGSTPRTISVTGVGYVETAPNIATISVGAESINQDVKVAVDDVNQRIEALTQALLEAGIEAKDIRTESYNIYQENYGPFEPGVEPQRSFRVFMILSVRVRQIDTVGALLSTMIDAGANAIHNIQFGVDDTSTPEAEARVLALQDARNRADQIAQELGVTIVGVQAVEEYGGGVGPILLDKVGIGGGGNTPISTGTLSITMSVRVSYIIE
jgi:hypothetical protein